MITPIIRVSTYIHIIENALERFSVFYDYIVSLKELYSKSEIELLSNSCNSSTNELARRFLRNGFSGSESIEAVIGLYFRLSAIRNKLIDLPYNHYILMQNQSGKAYKNPLEFLFFGIDFQVNSKLNLTHVSPDSINSKVNVRIAKRII